MAKKIIINGNDILNSINDPWSGKNEGSASIEIYDTPIPPKAEWGITNLEVERVLKKTFNERVGYWKIITAPDNVSNRIVGFVDSEAFSSWNELPELNKWGELGLRYIVTWDTLPSEVAEDLYYVDVLIKDFLNNYSDTNVTLELKGTSYVRRGGGEIEHQQETLTILVQTRTSTNNSWKNQESFTIESENDWEEISFSKYVVSGQNYIRIKATNENGIESLWKNLSFKVVNLSIVPNTATNLPVTGNKLTLNYLIGGNIPKYLRLMFGTGLGSTFEADWTYANCPACNILVNGTNTSTGFIYEFSPGITELTDILDEGVHTVLAQLYVDENLQTDWITIQYMVDNDDLSSPKLVVNNIANTLDNFTPVKFFDFAVSKTTNVVFRLTDENNQETYSTWKQEAIKEISYSFLKELNIEKSTSTFYARMHIEDTEGNELHPSVFFTINNNDEYAPVSNPVFIFLPSTRSNDELNPRTIINAATGLTVPSIGWDSLGMTSSDGYINGALVINAGSLITADINFLKTLANTSGSSVGLQAKNVTIKIKFKVSNIIDDTLPVIRLGSYFNTSNDNDIWGIEIRPTEAALLTLNNRVRDDQNVTWAEDQEVTLTFNIVLGLNPDNDPTGTKLNYIRLFVNDTIEKEIEYQLNDRFINSENALLIIGGLGANISIYNIRYYEKALSTSDVMKDYRSSLNTTEEKLEWINKNDILGDDNTININKAMDAGYNVIGHTGHLPKYGDTNKGKTKGVSLMIHINGDPEHSGVLTNLESSGQGTTAMTYYDWNLLYKIGDTTIFTPEEGDPTEPGTGYAILSGEALAKKLVGKINFASSMLGHKMGITRVYDEVFKALIDSGDMSIPYLIQQLSSARLTVLERPFLFFHRESEDDPWTFRYLMTFGAGKGDKPTFGFNKNTTPHMLMVEGADNDRSLALFNAPWNSEVNYSAENEAWYIGSLKHINFGYGKTSVVGGEEIPSDPLALQALTNFWNFILVHVRNISYYTGTLTLLKSFEPYAEGNSVPSTNIQYWITNNSDQLTSRYDLFRFDVGTNTWEKAGLEITDTLNVRTQYEEMCEDLEQTAENWPTGEWAIINNRIKTVRTNHFKKYAGDYMFIDDGLYHYNIIKLFAGTDNRSKNTYYYTDYIPSTEEIKIRWQLDDVDTTLKTNNIGQQRKPYYVEEHDKNSAGEFYWQAENSGLYCLIEEAFADELKTMMRRILSAMASLAPSNGGAFEYLVSRILEAQNYFPAVAYNEQARLVYERASVALADGTYINAAARAITQSNGTLLWSEYQWLLDRVMYISSWCEYGEFASSNNTPNTLTFRGYTGFYNFVLTPAKWLYPRIGQGGSNVAPSTISNHVRVPAGESFSYARFQNDGDTSISIRGINYYSEIGDMNVPVSPTQQTSFPFFGNKLKKVTINPNGTDTNLFTTQQITVSSINIIEFTARNIDTLTGALDLSQCNLLRKIDLRGSSVIRVSFPETASLTEVYLPSSITEVIIDNCPNLETLVIEGVNNIEKVNISNCPKIQPFDVVSDVYDLYSLGELVALENVTIQGVDVEDSTELDLLVWLASLNDVTITGRITFNNSVQLTFEQKDQLVQAFGNIDSDENPLRIIYNYNINPTLTVSIFCDGIADTVHRIGTYKFRYIPLSGGVVQNNANYISSTEWILEDNNYATIDSRGLMTVTSLGTDVTKPKVLLTLRATLINGTVLTNSLNLSMYDREIELGDYVFADGTYSKTDYPVKTKMGICFIKENGVTEICTLNDLRSEQWGLWESASQGVTGVTIEDTTIKAYDTPLDNLTVTNTFIAKDTNANYFNVEDDEFIDVTFTQDGKERAEGQLLFSPTENTVIDGLVENVQFEAGKNYSAGYRNTLIIMSWRNRILNYAEKDIPVASENETETQSLTRLISNIIAEAASQGASNSAYYRQYYYPAASYCHAYQPTIKSYETLNDKFKTHKWFLPSAGELARMVFYWLRDDTTGNSEYDAFKAAKDSGKIVFTNKFYWSSTECSSKYTWDVDGGNGYVRNYGYNNVSKSLSNLVRPVCTL